MLAVFLPFTIAGFIPQDTATKQIGTLFVVATCLGNAKGIGDAWVSTLVFNDGKRLRRGRAGAEIGTRSIERALQWFSDN